MRGFTLIEIIIIAGVIALALVGVLRLETASLRSHQSAEARTKAVFYLEEGYEALRSLRDSGWDANIAPVATELNYYLVFTDGNWQLTEIPPALLDGKFSRRVVFSVIYRDGAGNIAGAGSLDADTRRADIKVEWDERGDTAGVSGSTYLTNWRQ